MRITGDEFIYLHSVDLLSLATHLYGKWACLAVSLSPSSATQPLDAASLAEDTPLSSPLHMSLNLPQKSSWEAVFGRAGDARRPLSHKGPAALTRLPSLRSAGNRTVLTHQAKMWSKKCETDQHVAAGGREVQDKTIIKILMLNPRPLYPGITTSQLTVPDTAG